MEINNKYYNNTPFGMALKYQGKITPKDIINEAMKRTKNLVPKETLQKIYKEFEIDHSYNYFTDIVSDGVRFKVVPKDVAGTFIPKEGIVVEAGKKDAIGNAFKRIAERREVGKPNMSLVERLKDVMDRSLIWLSYKKNPISILSPDLYKASKLSDDICSNATFIEHKMLSASDRFSHFFD